MIVGMTDKTSKIMAILCIGITILLGVSCQLHASPHTHAIPAGGHSDHHEDLACIAGVIPSVDELPALSYFTHDVSFRAAIPIVPSFELDIPPRSSL